MSKSIDDQREVIQTRLGETIASFLIGKRINERGDIAADPSLNAKLRQRWNFWSETLRAHQLAMFTGLDSFLDDKRTDVATLYSFAAAVEALDPGKVPVDLLNGLPVIRDKYKIYRHKLFAHNDFKRPEIAKQFDAEGFTYQSLEADLNELEYIYKVLAEIATQAQMVPAARQPNWKPLTKSAALTLTFPYNAHVANVVQDTDDLLSDL